jgi:rfaE bifunctional protein kinase chain/domain
MNITEILNNIDKARVAVLGDFCLDIYWYADMRKSELSRETPHFPLPIVKEWMSPGAAGNVAENILALKPARVHCIGVFGNDWRGNVLTDLLKSHGADVSGIVMAQGRQTNTYIKPLRKGLTDVVYEDPRLDFANYTPLDTATEQKLLAALEYLADKIDVLCVCDQMPFGAVTPKIRRKICELGAQGLKITVDSRDRIMQYRNVIVKPNDIEACRALEVEPSLDMSTLVPLATRLSAHTGCPAVITAGPAGCAIADGTDAQAVKAVNVTGETDICGAGDTFHSGLACSLAAGAELHEAAAIANIAASVTVKMLKTTGTASRSDIMKNYATWQEG